MIECYTKENPPDFSQTLYMWLCEEVGIIDISESTAIILAILTGAEVISWRCGK